MNDLHPTSPDTLHCTVVACRVYIYRHGDRDMIHLNLRASPETIPHEHIRALRDASPSPSCKCEQAKRDARGTVWAHSARCGMEKTYKECRSTGITTRATRWFVNNALRGRCISIVRRPFSPQEVTIPGENLTITNTNNNTKLFFSARRKRCILCQSLECSNHIKTYNCSARCCCYKKLTDAIWQFYRHWRVFGCIVIGYQPTPVNRFVGSDRYHALAEYFHAFVNDTSQ